MTIAVVILLLAIGVLLEFEGLRTIWLDVRDVSRVSQRIGADAARYMGAGPEVVAGWIAEMAGVGTLGRRMRGLVLIATGLAIQTVANVVALWT